MADPYIPTDPTKLAAVNPNVADTFAPTAQTGGELTRQVGQTYNPATGKYEDSGLMGNQALETTAGQMTQLLSKQSPWMRQAATTGLQEAAKRGLLSSSIAIGAAEAERIRAAAPIAQATAQQFAAQAAANQDIMTRFGLQEQAGGLQRGQSALESQLKLGEAQMQGGIQKELTQEAGLQERLGTAMKGIEERTTLAVKGTEERKSIVEQATQEKGLISARTAGEATLISAKTAAEQTLIGERTAADIAKEQAASAEAIRRLGFDIAGKLQGTFTESMRNTIDRAAQEITKIETSDQLSPDAKKNIVQSILDQRNQDLKFMSDLYSALPAWQPTWTVAPLTGGTPPSGTAIPGAPNVSAGTTTPTNLSKP
jgi:hypothetical protein